MRPDFVLGDDGSLLKSCVVDCMGVLEVLDHLEESFGVRVGEDGITDADLAGRRRSGRDEQLP